VSTISTHDLTVRYGDLVALDNVSVTAAPGLTVVIGVNGSGKSSLLGAICGAVQPASGTVRIGDESAALARQQGAVAFVPQADAVDRDFPVTVRQVVEMGTNAANVSRRDGRRRAHAAIERVGLAGLEQRQIGELSGGQRRRVMVARAVAQEAKVLVLDEPDAGVDSSARSDIYALLRSFVDDGRTVLMSTHDLASVPDIADHAIVLHRRVIAEGSPSAVLTPHVLAQAFGVAP
jgi:manganese transport system ATP-binding protein